MVRLLSDVFQHRTPKHLPMEININIHIQKAKRHFWVPFTARLIPLKSRSEPSIHPLAVLRTSLSWHSSPGQLKSLYLHICLTSDCPLPCKLPDNKDPVFLILCHTTFSGICSRTGVPKPQGHRPVPAHGLLGTGPHGRR